MCFLVIGFCHMCVFIAGAMRSGLVKSQARSIDVARLSHNPLAIFANVFAEHGAIQHLKIVMDRRGGRSMGYGFVRFSTAEQAATTEEAHTLHDRQAHARQVALDRAASAGGVMWDPAQRRWVPRVNYLGR